MPWQYSVRTHIVIALCLCLGGTGAVWWLFTGHQHDWQHWLACWLIVVNLVTFAYYGLDKYLARMMVFRIPEKTLHTLSAVGGSPAALLAMWLFRHKTIKRSFRILFWCIVVLQTALTIYIVKLTWWN
jgi:uncharacterized membrane protein YsdA (DUF1294 family)